MRKLEEFARKAMVPLGYLFLSSPPQESIGIPDFRTCNEPLDFVGKLKSSTSVVRAADQIRSRLGLQSNWQLAQSTWEAALTTLRRAMESIGGFVCVTNQVGLNTRRSLNREIIENWRILKQKNKDQPAPVFWQQQQLRLGDRFN